MSNKDRIKIDVRTTKTSGNPNKNGLKNLVDIFTEEASLKTFISKKGENIVDNFSITDGEGFEFFSGIEPVYKEKFGLELPFTGYRYYNKSMEKLYLVGLLDGTNAGGTKQIIITELDFINNINTFIVTFNGAAKIAVNPLSGGTGTGVHVKDGEIRLTGLPEFTTDIVADAALSSGDLYKLTGNRTIFIKP